MTFRPASADAELCRLADAHGVAVTYLDQLRRPVEVAADSVIGVLGALGVDASSPAAVREALHQIEGASPTPPVVVVRRSRGGSVAVGTASMLRLEDGTHRTVSTDGGRVVVPPGLPLGWHCLETGEGEIPVVVTPDTVTPRPQRQWGWAVQLYAMRSRQSWGIGDLADLERLVRWTGEHEGGVVLVNPLHAVAPGVPMQPSPYFPASRRWTNPVYLAVERTNAYANAAEDVRRRVDELRVSSDGARIDRDAAWTAKLSALELLWSERAVPAGTVAELEGLDPALRDFATWCALAELHGADWRKWPESLRRPDSPSVGQARSELTERVRFHVWLQMLCDDQLAAGQQAARDIGMDVGVVHDLAVGTDPGGADAWALQDALALGARVGAPPDTFNQQGQDWGLPPWHPRRLAELGYAPLRDMVRSLLRHAGGVRIDHILGMFRLWWIPEGSTARDGTYVSYDADALLGVIALEAERAGAIVVGEDLGTVPPQVRTVLSQRGVLGSSVLWFERDEAEAGETGALSAPGEWREAAMASVTTHDLPTALGWLRGEHVRVRAELGLLDDPAAEERSWQAERRELLEHLVAAGVLDSVDSTEGDQVRALHAFLAATPSRYVLAAPGDAVGDLNQPNLPGTVDEYPNWRLPVCDAEGRPLLLEVLLADPRVLRLADELAAGIR
ncbi:MAG TPA: 4-alpha-glucanotransferase [Mycobacteriales bacterium]|nr:4-alpha-glucanotransferase [Mycobacteriales bacterium]